MDVILKKRLLMKKIYSILILLLLFIFHNAETQKTFSLSIDQIVKLAKEARLKQELYVIDYTCFCIEELRILDKNGEIKHQETTKRKVYVKGDITHDQLVSIQKKEKAFSDKEITERQKEIDKEERKKGKEKDSRWISPFEEKGEGKFEFKLLREDTLNSHATYVIFVDPKEKAKELLRGLYWIDKQSYRILRSEFSPSENPQFVKEMKIFVDFMEVDNGVFLPQVFKIKGKGGFLFFKTNFEMERTCQDYEINVGLKEEIFPELQGQ
jgi:hypothetical protein